MKLKCINNNCFLNEKDAIVDDKYKETLKQNLDFHWRDPYFLMFRIY